MIKLKDCREVSYRGGLVITDPPYNIGYKYNGEFKDRQSTEEYQSLFEPMKGERVVLIHYAESIIQDITNIGQPKEMRFVDVSKQHRKPSMEDDCVVELRTGLEQGSNSIQESKRQAS